MNQKHLQIKISFVFIVLICSLFPFSAKADASSETNITALDTIANFETLIKAKSLSANTEVVFTIRKPDGSTVKYYSKSDQSGNSSVNVKEADTLIAGIYRVSVNNEKIFGEFKVFPGETSASISSIYSNKANIGANGADFAIVKVRITDEFANPLEFHEVKLISDRNSDVIISKTNETDASGIINFVVSSKQVGTSILSATDESVPVNLAKQVKVVFYNSPNVSKDIGGDPETVLLAQSDPAVSRFDILNLPASAKAYELVNFKVKALDGSGNVVPSYVGSIIFSSSDTTAQLPVTYTFKASDQGQKTFDLALSFRTVGTQKLTVQQVGNALIKGEKNIEITAGTAGESGAIRITKPATGTYSVNRLEIAGTASSNVGVKLFDNSLLLAEITSNSSGAFSYNTNPLTDGQHTFYAKSNGATSAEVSVTIDSTPSKVESFEIVKKVLAPGETTQIVINSDPDLTSITATVGELIKDLEAIPTDPGVYRGTITAPLESGEYQVSIIVTDKMGNASPAVEIGKITVDANLSTNESTFEVPSKVNGVRVGPGNGRVTLTWEPASAAAGIALYRIYYGTDPSKLNSIINTRDAKTTWYVPNLVNGTTYYFQVTGIDSNGNEGDTWSNMVNGVPSGSVSPVLCDPMPCPPDVTYPPYTPEDGPEVLGMILISILGSTAIKIFKKKK